MTEGKSEWSMSFHGGPSVLGSIFLMVLGIFNLIGIVCTWVGATIHIMVSR